MPGGRYLLTSSDREWATGDHSVTVSRLLSNFASSLVNKQSCSYPPTLFKTRTFNTGWGSVPVEPLAPDREAEALRNHCNWTAVVDRAKNNVISFSVQLHQQLLDEN